MQQTRSKSQVLKLKEMVNNLNQKKDPKLVENASKLVPKQAPKKKRRRQKAREEKDQFRRKIFCGNYH
jgi:hypothetical protein